jgi:hypothetical protein
VLEAASASAIEAMLYSKAVIVTDTGFYADIPDMCAIKIKHSNEISEIQSCLIALLDDRTRVAKLGSAARRWAIQTYTAKNYAEQLELIVFDILRVAPAINAIDYFCGTLRQWSDAGDSLLAVELYRNLDIFELGCSK